MIWYFGWLGVGLGELWVLIGGRFAWLLYQFVGGLFIAVFVLVVL